MICFWLLLNNTSKNGYLFAPFSSFLKKVASFSRAQAQWFSRGRLARQAPAFGWGGHRGGPTSRWFVIAVVQNCAGRTSRFVVIQVLTHRVGHTTPTINLTTIRNQWLYTITGFPGKMIHPVKVPRPVAPRWRKKIAEEASVENGQHILLGQIYSGANSSSAKIFSLAEVLRQGMKMFQENDLNFFFEKLEITQFAKWSHNIFFNLPCNFHLKIVDLAKVSKNGHRNSMLGAYVARTFNSP